MAKIYRKSNIADKLQPFVNNERFGKYVSKTHKMDLAVRNRNTGKIHKTTCDYAWASGDVELIKKPLALTNTASCCFPQRKHRQPNYTYKKVNFKNYEF